MQMLQGWRGHKRLIDDANEYHPKKSDIDMLSELVMTVRKA